MMRGPSTVVAKVISDQEPANPKQLLKRVNLELEDEGLEEMSPDELVDLLLSVGQNEPVHSKFYIMLGQSMSESNLLSAGAQAAPTESMTHERRIQIHRLLGLPEYADDDLIKTYPDPVRRRTHVIESDEPWDVWHPRAGQKSFYWDHYVKVLRDKDFGDEAIANLDDATSAIVGRLADPSREAPYQSKGLVVGYVQSGKTANFAGTIAKSIDAGYKLIIVLTGTIELLRAQTQKRLDKELVGEENVLGGAGPNIAKLQKELDALDPNAEGYDQQLNRLATQIEDQKKGVDYVEQDDQDWKEGKFSKLGVLPRQVGSPTIIRVTTLKDDYKGLKSQLQVIDFERNRQDWSKPIYHPSNIDTGDVWLAVVKKNPSTLRKLRADLEKMQTSLEDIPALIIDDEADQASVNTKKPKTGRGDKEERDRTTINNHISGMLRSMPRSQYLAYTATPYANVFVDPVDSGDIFPKDFIAALEPSPDYMGAKSYHDIDPSTRVDAMSNRDAYYRPVSVDDVGMAELQGVAEALDAYVLSGAIKLWRRTVLDDPSSLKHHTMMVHEASKTAQHEDSKMQVVTAWNRANFSSPRGIARLKKLWEDDFSAVCAERAAGAPVPRNFDEIKPYIAETVQKVNSSRQLDGRTNPVVVVNGTKNSEYAQPDINFDTDQGVWKILVGGTKLSRGFTVEGLTVTLYTRVTVAADTLMQMGRWFGYRKHYRDLVRLYLGADIQRRKGAVDLYDSFTSIAQDEEDFRSELVRYSEAKDDGRPVVTPMDVAPLVTQRLPWLKPTGANKMHNAVIVEQGLGGKLADLFAMKKHGSGANTRNLRLIADLLPRLDRTGSFDAGNGTSYGVAYGVVDARTMVEFLEGFTFFDSDAYGPRIRFIRSRIGKPLGGIDDFVVYIPTSYSTVTVERDIPGYESSTLPIIKRSRRPSRSDFSGSAPRHRVAAEALAGKPEYVAGGIGGGLVDRLRAEGHGRRGAMMINLAADQAGGGDNGRSDPTDLTDPVDAEDIVTLVSYAIPYDSAPEGVLLRTVLVPSMEHEPVVDNDKQ